MGFSGSRPRDLEGAPPAGCVLHFACYNLAMLKGLRLDVEDHPARTKMGRLVRRKLKAVEAYEAGREEALRVSCIEDAELARHRALYDLEDAGNAIAKAPALTVAGLQIKARAFSTFLSVAARIERYRVGGDWGAALAAATLAVTGAA